jgi:hypothetical protein
MAAIEVRFKDYGLKILEVIDNGSGIAPENYESIGKPIVRAPFQFLSDQLRNSIETPHIKTRLVL